jgi:drug/metabolite transporter (DMT)-like permease
VHNGEVIGASSLPAVLAGVVSAALHAGWNALVKTTPNPRAGTLLTLTGAFACVWLVVFGLSLMGALAPANLSRWVLVAGLGEVAYVWSLGKALERGPLGVTYALSRAIAMLAIWPLSYGVFGTSLTAFGLLGSLLVVLGVALIRPAKAEGTLSLGYTVLSGLAVGVYHTGYKGCVRAGMPFTQAFAYALLVAVPVLWVLLGRSLGAAARTLLQVYPLRLTAAALGCAGSFLLAVWALARADSGVVLGLRNSSIAFGLMFALLLGERPRTRDWLGVCLFVLSVFAFAHA